VKNAVESSREETAEMPAETISNILEEGNEQIQQHEQPQESNAQVSTQLPKASSSKSDSTRMNPNSEETEQQEQELNALTKETDQHEVNNAVESSRKETAEETISYNRDKGNEHIQQLPEAPSIGPDSSLPSPITTDTQGLSKIQQLVPDKARSKELRKETSVKLAQEAVMKRKLEHNKTQEELQKENCSTETPPGMPPGMPGRIRHSGSL